MNPSRPVVRRLVAFFTAVATLIGLAALAPAVASADDAPTTFSISGTVTDDTGAPAAGVTVDITPPAPFSIPVTTDANGHYSAAGFLPGSYTVTFVPPFGGPLLGETYKDAANSWTGTPVVVSTGDATGIDASLDRASSIAGRVLDADGHPVPGVGVTMNSAAFSYAAATTAADGTYSATRLRAGDWRISFTAPNGSAWVSELYDDAHTPDSQTVVALAPGTALTLNDAVLARGNAITGRVLAPDGSPKAGIEVWASTPDGSNGGATTDADGIYAITGLADGDYSVYAQSDWAANLVGVVYPGGRDWNAGEDVHVAGAETVTLHDLTLIAGATVTGTVFGPDGTPMAHAFVDALSDTDQNGAYTGSDGSFSINLLSPGTYRVSARSDWGAAASIVQTYYAASPGETRFSQATPVVLAAGGTADGIAIHTSAKGSASVTLVATAAHAPVLGEPFSIDVTVTGAQGTPTGSVWVGNSLARTVVYADADLVDGHATLTFDAIDQGTYPWVDVWYVGDATYGTGAAMVDYVPGGPAPSIDSLAPPTGSVLGGQQVSISGSGFGPDTSVTFGGVPAAVMVDGPGSLVATAPAHAAGPVDVVVTTQGRTSAPATYTYEKATTTLALIGPVGPTTSGAAASFAATVSSTAGTPTGSVEFVVDGAAPVAVPLAGGVAQLSTTGLAVGSHTVSATYAGDTTYATSTAQVAHTVTGSTGKLPVVGRALPSTGLTTGGSLTIVTGKNFVKGRTTVAFGSVAATSVTVLNSTTLLVVVPKHGAGAVHLTAATPAGSSTTWASFTYVAPPIRHPLPCHGVPRRS